MFSRRALLAASVVGMLVIGIGLASAASHPDFPAAMSQLAWMKKRGAAFDDWATKTANGSAGIQFAGGTENPNARGWHPAKVNGTCDNSLCHDGKGLPKRFPADKQQAVCGRTCHTWEVIEDFSTVNFSSFPYKVANKTTSPCGTACHGWLKGIDEPGFSPLAPQSGEAGYNGSIQPLYLLSEAKDMDGDGRNHQTLYQEFGCAGMCHNQATTIEDAEAWANGGAPSNLSRGAVHNAVTTCTQCHRFESPINGPSDLHTTHIPFLGAENVLATGGVTATCGYCHGTSTLPTDPPAQGGGCYNCHLSGHRPETYYWSALPG